MSNQATAEREQCARLVAAGTDLGLWVYTRTPRDYCDPDAAHYTGQSAAVITGAGLAFCLGVGGWRQEGKAVARVATLSQDTLTVTPRAVEASVSLSRGYDVAAKELHRRVMASPDGVKSATEARDELAKRVRMRNELARFLKKAEAMGYRIPQQREGVEGVPPGDHYSVFLYGQGNLPSIELYHDGHTRITHAHGLELDLCNIPRLAALLDREH